MSNAPHIPVHLGAMQETVQYQVSEYLEIENYFNSFRSHNFWNSFTDELSY